MDLLSKKTEDCYKQDCLHWPSSSKPSFWKSSKIPNFNFLVSFHYFINFFAVPKDETLDAIYKCSLFWPLNATSVRVFLISALCSQNCYFLGGFHSIPRRPDVINRTNRVTWGKQYQNYSGTSKLAMLIHFSSIIGYLRNISPICKLCVDKTKMPRSNTAINDLKAI